MSISRKICTEENCSKEDRKLLSEIEKKINIDLKGFLISDIDRIYRKFSKDMREKYTEKKILFYSQKCKQDILENIENYIDMTRITEKTLYKIEDANNLEKYTLIDKKLYIISGAYKIYGMKLYGLYLKLLRNVYENQTFKTKINFTEKQKIMLETAAQSYRYSIKDKSFRPTSFIDKKFKSIYEYQEDTSDINKSIWINNGKNIFRKKVVIIAYRGTGVEVSKNKFMYSGNLKRDFSLDLKIGQGKISGSEIMKKIIKDFDKIYRIYGKEYDFYLTGHSLGGRLAFEIHRIRPKKIKECHIFNAGFGLDINYLKDILKSQKRDYDWEKNLYNYHIGGEDISPIDDDYVSVLSGGYGKSSTFYKNFNKGLKGHALLNFEK